MTDDPRPLSEQPLYKVQERALVDEYAAVEAARRYAAERSHERMYGPYSTQYERRIALTYLAGLRAAPNDHSPYKYGRGGNYARTLRDAWNAGRELRQLLEQERRKRS